MTVLFMCWTLVNHILVNIRLKVKITLTSRDRSWSQSRFVEICLTICSVLYLSACVLFVSLFVAMSLISNVVSVSGLSILDCPLGFLKRLFAQCFVFHSDHLIPRRYKLYEYDSCSWLGVRHATLCEKVC